MNTFLDYIEIIGRYLTDYRTIVVGGYLTSVLCTGLALIVYYGNPLSRRCRYAALFNASIGFWSFFFATHFYVTDKTLGILCTQFLSFGTICLSVFLTHFVLIDTERERKYKSFLLINYLVSIFIAGLLFIPGLVVDYPVSKLGLPSYTEQGPLYSLIPGQLFFNLIFSSYQIWQALKKAPGSRKAQLRLFSAALLVGYASGTPAYLLVYDVPVPPTSAILVVLVPLIFTYSIKKHQFLNISKLLKNTLIFSLLLSVLIVVFSGVAFILQTSISQWIGVSKDWAQFIAIAIVMPLVGPLRTGLSFLTNKMLYHHSENPQIIFKKLADDVLKNLDSKKLVYDVTNSIALKLALDRVAFFSRDSKNPTVFKVQSVYGNFEMDSIIHQSKQLVIYLQKHKDFLLDTHDHREDRYQAKKDSPGPFLTSDTETRQQATIELSKLGGVAAIPIFVKNKLHSIIILGDKKSDATWSRHDEELEALKSFIPQLSIAIGTAEYKKELDQSRKKLLASEPDLMGAALVAGVDHEAKTPLHSIVLANSIMKSKLQNPEIAKGPWDTIEKLTAQKMERTLQNVHEIASIIKQLEDLSKKNSLVLEDGIKPKIVARKVIEDLTGSVWPEGIEVRSKIPSKLFLTCDSQALYTVLKNLVVNASQAITDKGSITLEGYRKFRKVVIQVQDTGAGIPQKLVDKIFEPYFTTKKKKDHFHEAGTGRGLFIVKQTMQEFGGDVEVISAVGKGTIFKLHFPDLPDSESIGRRAA